MKLLYWLLLAHAAALALWAQPTSGHVIRIMHRTDSGPVDSGFHREIELKGSVAELKNELARHFQVPRSAVHVYWRDYNRPDSFDLEECISSSPESLYLVLDSHLIKVAKPDGSHTVLAIEESDTIADLKRKIENKEHIPLVLQRLIRENQELHDSQRFASSSSDNGKESALNLVLKPAYISVKLPSGELITFRYEPTEQVSDLKDKIQKERGIARDLQSLSIRNKGEIADDELLISFGISRDSILTLEQLAPGEPTILHVRLASKRLLTFEMDFSETVASLKGKICRAEGIPQGNQHLYFVPGKELADNARISDYVKKSESVLQLHVCDHDGQGAYHVHVLSPGGESTNIPILAIKPGDTVATIKSRIHTDNSIPQDHTVHLYFEGKELEDDKLVLEHATNNGSNLNLIMRRRDGPEMIHVTLPSGRVVTFNVALSSKVTNLKESIEHGYGTLSAKRQQIFLNNQELVNDKTLGECNLVSGSTVNLILGPQVDMGNEALQ